MAETQTTTTSSTPTATPPAPTSTTTTPTSTTPAPTGTTPAPTGTTTPPTGTTPAPTGTTTTETPPPVAPAPVPPLTSAPLESQSGVAQPEAKDFKFTLKQGNGLADVELAEGDGGVKVKVKSSDDILGVFFNVKDNAKLSGASASGSEVISSAFSASQVKKPGKNPGINTAFDGGVETGNPGAGKGVLNEVEFVLKGLTLADLKGESFGVRTQSSQLVGSANPPAPPAPPPAPGTPSTPGTPTSEVPPVAPPPTGTDGSNSEVPPAEGGSDFTGTSSGKFTGPEEPGEAVIKLVDVNGGDDNRFEWGVPVGDSFVNVLQFDGVDFDVKPNEKFSLGKLLYRNGTVAKFFNGEFGFTVDLNIAGLSDATGSATSEVPATTTPSTTNSEVPTSTTGTTSTTTGTTGSTTGSTSTTDTTSTTGTTTTGTTPTGTTGTTGGTSTSEVPSTSTSELPTTEVPTTSEEDGTKLSFDYLFDIFNTVNTTGDPVKDGDRLRFSSGGTSPVKFEVGGQEYTVQLLGFSSDGGKTTRSGFNAPEETGTEAELFAKIVPLSEDAGDLFEPLSDDVAADFEGQGGVLVTSKSKTKIKGKGKGAVAGSLVIKSKVQIEILWGTTTAATLAQYAPIEDANGDSNGDGLSEIDLSTANSSNVISSDDSEEIVGTSDNDSVIASGGDDVVELAAGNDVFAGGTGDDDSDGGDGIDSINGNEGDDDCNGGDGDDLIRGGKGKDKIKGGKGKDVLIGDLGEDELTGGEGNDTFCVKAEYDFKLKASSSIDIITDFKAGEDTIAMSRERFIKQDIKFEISDYNADGVSDFVMRFLESNAPFGVVLNVGDLETVKSAIVQTTENDFVGF